MDANKTGIVDTIPVDFYNKNERLQQALFDGLRLLRIICAGTASSGS